MKDISRLVFWLASMMAALMGFMCIRAIVAGTSMSELFMFIYAFLVPATVAFFAHKFGWRNT